MLPTNRPVRAVLRDGTVVTGRRLNEDTFTVQLVDSNERLVSLDRAAIREYTRSARSRRCHRMPMSSAPTSVPISSRIYFR